MKRTGIDHPKVRRLARLLDLPHYGAVGVLECLWHFVAKHAIRGDLGKWSDEEIAAAIDWPLPDAARLIGALIEAGLVDVHPVYRLVVHDWHDHCDDVVRKTVKTRKKWNFATEEGPGPSDVADESGTCPDTARSCPDTDQSRPDADQSCSDSGGSRLDSHSHSQSRSHSQSLSPSQERSTSTASRDDHFDADLWERVRVRANSARATTKLPMSRPEDRSLILKCCALVERGDLPEAWWTDAIGSVSRTNGAVGTIANKMGYLYTTLVTNAAEKYHAKLEPLLAAIDVPAAILAPKKPQPTEV